MGWLGQCVRISAYLGAAGLLLAGGLVVWRAAAAARTPSEAACAVKAVERAKVVEVLDGAALKLQDGRRVLLSGVGAPRTNGKGAGAEFAAEAQRALSRLVLNQDVRLGEASKPSKSGWVRAQVMAGDGKWIQGELVSGGYAWVRTFPDRRECSSELLKREAGARAAKKGLWALPVYGARKPEEAASGKGRFSFVEGVVTRAADVNGLVFLNFGEDYRTDFTVQIRQKARALFAGANAGLENLEGKRVRVRGFVQERNGPMIDVNVPEQIEVLANVDP